MEQNILSISLKDYRKELDELRASLLSLEKGSEAYQKTVNDIKTKQQQLNEVMAIGKKDTDALDGSYNALQQQMSKLRQEWKATNDEARRNDLSLQINDINEQLKELDATTGNYQRSVGNYAIAGESMKSQLKAMKEEMAQMLAQGVEPSNEKFQELVQQAGRLEDAMGDASAMIKQAANDTSTLATVVDVAKTGVAAFGAWQSALAAFGVEDDRVVQSIQKMQAAITMLNSLQQLQTALVDKSSKTYQLWNKVIAWVTGSEVANTKAVQANTSAQAANAVATTGAATALKVFRAALISTGIGALVVALGALVANWDKLSEAIFGATKQLKDFNAESKRLSNMRKYEDREIEKHVKEMKIQGKTEKEIYDYRSKAYEAQEKKAIQDRINAKKDLDAVNAKKKATKEEQEGAQKAYNEAKAREKAIHEAREDYVYDYKVNEIEKQKQTNKTTAAVKNHTDAVKDLAKEQKEQASTLERVIDDDTEYLKLQAKLEHATGALSDKQYEDRLVEIDKGRVNRLYELADMYKDNAELQVFYANKAMEESMKVQITEAENAAERMKEKILSNYNDAVNQIHNRVDSESAKVEHGANMTAINMTGDDNPFTKQKSVAEQLIELEMQTQQRLFDIREKGRQDEKSAIATHYGELIAQAAGNNEEIERLTKERDGKLTEIDTQSNEERMQLEETFAQGQKDLQKAEQQSLQAWANKTQKTISDYASSISGLMSSIGDIMENNIKQRVENGEISQEEAEKEFERVKGMQIAITWMNTLAGAAGGLLQGIANYPPPYGAIMGGIAAATAIATGVAQTQQIKNSKFGEGGSGGGAGGGAATVPEISVAPLLNEELDAQSMTALNTEAIANGQGEQRVWISQHDLTKSDRQVQIRQSETTF